MVRRKTVQRDPLGRVQSEFEEEEENDGILRDGQSLRVPLYLRDGAINPNLLPHQKAKAMHQTEDAAARRFGLSDGLQLHRPGFRRVTDAAALQRTQQAYNDYDAADARAYKCDYSEHTGGDPSRTGAGAPNRGSGAPAGAYPYSAAAEGTSCSTDGRPGTLQRQGAWLVCVPNKQRQDAMGLDAKQQAYRAYDEEQANAWRGSNR